MEKLTATAASTHQTSRPKDTNKAQRIKIYSVGTSIITHQSARLEVLRDNNDERENGRYQMRQRTDPSILSSLRDKKDTKDKKRIRRYQRRNAPISPTWITEKQQRTIKRTVLAVTTNQLYFPPTHHDIHHDQTRNVRGISGTSIANTRRTRCLGAHLNSPIPYVLCAIF